jgi:hypothetical protein
MTEAEFERIDDFLAGKLTSDEQRRMEAEIAQNAELREAIDKHRVVRESLQVLAAKGRFQTMHRQLERMGLIEQPENEVEEEPEVILVEDTTPDLEVVSHEVQEPVSRRETRVIPIRRNYFWQYAAASVLIGGLLGALFLFQYLNRGTDEAEVTFRQYYQPEAAVNEPQLPPAEQHNERALAEAIQAYRQSKFALSEKQFKTLKTPSNGAARYYQEYYLGLIALENNKASQAIDHLEVARQSPQLQIQQRSEWYLGLAYLKAHRPNDAKSLFTQIAATPSHLFRTKASELVRKHY